jgi:hypothetical protein
MPTTGLRAVRDRAVIERDTSSQFGRGSFLVRFEKDGRLDHVHESRLVLIDAAEDLT